MHLTHSMDRDNFNRENDPGLEWKLKRYGNQHLAFEFYSLFQLLSFCSFFLFVQFLIFICLNRIVVSFEFSFYVLCIIQMLL